MPVWKQFLFITLLKIIFRRSFREFVESYHQSFNQSRLTLFLKKYLYFIFNFFMKVLKRNNCQGWRQRCLALFQQYCHFYQLPLKISYITVCFDRKWEYHSMPQISACEGLPSVKLLPNRKWNRTTRKLLVTLWKQAEQQILLHCLERRSTRLK